MSFSFDDDNLSLPPANSSIVNPFQHTVEDDSSKGYIAWRRRRVHFDPKVSATMPRPTLAMLTPSSRFSTESTQMKAERDFYRLKAAASSNNNNNSSMLHHGSSTTSNFITSSINKEILDDSHWIPQWLREDANNNNNKSSGGSSVTSALTNRTTKTSATGAASSALPGEARFYGSHFANGEDDGEEDGNNEDDDDSDEEASAQAVARAAARRRRRRMQAAAKGGHIADMVLTLEELINSPMAFTQRLLDLHDELRDVEAACKILVQKALRLDAKSSVTEILEGSSELSYHSIKVDAVDGEIRRIQREITGTFSVVDGAIIAGSENMPAEKCTSLLNALRACIPEVRSTIRLADTRLTSLLM